MTKMEIMMAVAFALGENSIINGLKNNSETKDLFRKERLICPSKGIRSYSLRESERIGRIELIVTDFNNVPAETFVIAELDGRDLYLVIEEMTELTRIYENHND